MKSILFITITSLLLGCQCNSSSTRNEQPIIDRDAAIEIRTENHSTQPTSNIDSIVLIKVKKDAFMPMARCVSLNIWRI